jgi:pimeloyl-ACP methyl ester carboxylesterase
MDLFLPASLFIFFSATFWYLQLATGYFARHYFVQIGLLSMSGLCGTWLTIVLYPFSSIWVFILGLSVFTLSVVTIALAIIKLFFRSGDRARDLHSASRQQTRFTSKIKRFSLITDDGIKIQVIHMVGDKRRDEAVIICHGGARNKDIQANVMTCELLFEEYDVFTFDFRGHHESGGKWTGDGATKYDLKAVIDYADKMGYEKVGVVGWSFGAWTAVIEVAEFQNACTVVAAAPPPTDMREVKLTKPLFSWGYKPLALPMRILVTIIRGVRIGKYNIHPSLMDYVGRVSPVPLLIVGNEYDSTIGIKWHRFEELYDKAQEPKRLYKLNGRGHIYDWPNTFHYLNLVQEWLSETMN